MQQKANATGYGDGRIACPRCRANNFVGQAQCWQCRASLPPPEAVLPQAFPAARPTAPAHPPTPRQAAPPSGLSPKAASRIIAVCIGLIAFFSVVLAMQRRQETPQAVAVPAPARTIPALPEVGAESRPLTAPEAQRAVIGPMPQSPLALPAPSLQSEVPPLPLMARPAQEQMRKMTSETGVQPGDLGAQVPLQGGGSLTREEYNAAVRKLANDPRLRQLPSPSR